MDLNDLKNQGVFSLDLFEELYTNYKKDPSSVNTAWRQLFEQLDKEQDQKRKSAIPEFSSQPALLPEEIAGKSILYYPHVEMNLPGQEFRILRLIDAIANMDTL